MISREQEIVAVIKQLRSNEIEFIVVGGFAKYLHKTAHDFRDVDLFIPFYLNKSELVIKFLRIYVKDYPIDTYDFDNILRLKVGSLQIDLLPKLNGLISKQVVVNSIAKKYGEETVKVISKNDLITNIEAVEKLINQ